jgi:hypothetical protein
VLPSARVLVNCKESGYAYMKITENLKDPVFVSESRRGRWVVLRIGEPRRGESRIAELSLSQARRVACALLSEAERMDGVCGFRS